MTAVREGLSEREAARKFRVALSTVQLWVTRARGRPLSEVDWASRAPIARSVRRTPKATEDLVIATRRHHREQSPLGEYGADAIHSELLQRGRFAPSVRTIGRILERRGELDGKRRVRRPPPPPGWYLPDCATRVCELDAFDLIEDLAIYRGQGFDVLNGISLHGGLAASWPATPMTARAVLDYLWEHWSMNGLPAYAQFDNGNVFQGPHQHRDSVGRVTRFCLSLGISAVFAPPRESGFQGPIEGFNNRWQAAVWRRARHRSLDDVRTWSHRFIEAHRRKHAARIDGAPARRAFPKDFDLDLQTHPSGRIVYIRRTDSAGVVSLLGRPFRTDAHWQHRLVRAEVMLAEEVVRFFALRRRAPNEQPLLAERHYALPRRRFAD